MLRQYSNFGYKMYKTAKQTFTNSIFHKKKNKKIKFNALNFNNQIKMLFLIRFRKINTLLKYILKYICHKSL